ncbi:MAG: response regulator [Phycisphaerae bacterium]|nr:response regulator [Phycisphaerae bacterium]NUQ45673.1 response regulator [Phycisphaerae bacterium]
MSRVLIVDDEPGYCDNLRTGLSRLGYEVRSALSGREAIDVGTAFRPEVLVTDWLLKNSINGLHVAQSLRAVSPDLRTIMITGYGSGDVRIQARKADVLDLIEKPFKLTRLHDALRTVLAAEKPAPPEPQVAVMLVDAAGDLMHANARARTLMHEALGGEPPHSFADMFAAGASPDLSAASHGWVEARTASRRGVTWRIRTRPLLEAKGWLVVVGLADDVYLQDHTLVRTLLNIPPAHEARWPIAGHALVVDEQAISRRMVINALQSIGCSCHSAESAAAAVKFVQNDRDIRVVILDVDMPGSRVDSFSLVGPLVTRLRQLRPSLVFVGNSTIDRREDFAAHGVTRFLQEPWDIDDLIRLLTGRMGNCLECGLTLPLRQPSTGETAGAWVCRGCGARYQGVLDEAFPETIREHVRSQGS